MSLSPIWIYKTVETDLRGGNRNLSREKIQTVLCQILTV
jgi:hypothetical protein